MEGRLLSNAADFSTEEEEACSESSMFEAHVRNTVGSTMIAKSIITLGPTRVDQILILLAQHRQSATHAQSVSETHLASDEVKATRRQYRTSRQIYERGKQEYFRHDWERSEPSEVVSQFQSGLLRGCMQQHKQAADLVRAPRDTFFTSLSNMHSW